jgi:hypothetical protein
MYFDESLLFRGKDYVLNNHIQIHQPTVGEIFDYGEERYINIIHNICATPSDLKHQLFDHWHLYFNEIDEFDLFVARKDAFPQSETQILFGDLDLSSMKQGFNPEINQSYLYNNNGLIIDKVIYTVITEYIRKINGLKKNIETAANKSTRDVMIMVSRQDAEADKNKPFKSPYISIISALINTPESKYDYKTIWDLPVYVFFNSIQRIQKIKYVNYVMQGYYSGTIDKKHLNNKELDWMGEL